MNNFVVGKNISINFDTDECIPWPLRVMKNGYGVKSDRSYPQRIVVAHRWVWEQLVGPIPDEMHLDHLCHNWDLSCPGGWVCLHRRCINLRHLEVVTPTINNERMLTVKKPKLVCNHGHDLTIDGAVVMRSNGNGRVKRRCHECELLAGAAYRDDHREHVNSYMSSWREKRRLDKSI